ncbi:MAG: hypothetical protein ACRES8_03190 [Nevskiaceae bacterium]
MLKPFSFVTIAGLAVALVAPGVSAQTKKDAPMATPVAAPAPAGSVGAGDTELNFFGTLSDSDAGFTTAVLGIAFGTYVSDNMELKLSPALILLDSDDASAFLINVAGSVEFQFRPAPGSPVVLYAGGGAGLLTGSVEAAGEDYFAYSLYLTPVGGVKYFLDERTSLTYSLSYQFPLLGAYCGDVDCFDVDVTTLQNFIGFSIYY